MQSARVNVYVYFVAVDWAMNNICQHKTGTSKPKYFQGWEVEKLSLDL